MVGQWFALQAPEGADAASGAGGGEESSEGKRKDDDYIPKTQFIAAINSANAKYDALKSELDALRAEAAKKPADQPRRFTRAELNAMVESRQITQEQAEAQLEHQTREDIRAETHRAVTETVTQAQRKATIDSEIAKYKVLEPDILDDTKEVRQRIKEEYSYLVGTLGDPKTVETELKAIRAVLGPVERLERSRVRPSFESHRETGGDGGGTELRGRSKDGKLTYDDLTPREKAHYDKLLASGHYKDKKAINDELAFANPNTRRKYGAING